LLIIIEILKAVSEMSIPSEGRYVKNYILIFSMGNDLYKNTEIKSILLRIHLFFFPMFVQIFH